MARNKQPIDLTSLRYVLYARKSTDETDSKQVYSLDDQVKDCEKLAKDLELNVVEVLRESKSAKIRGKRPVFDQMVKDIGTSSFLRLLQSHFTFICYLSGWKNIFRGRQPFLNT